MSQTNSQMTPCKQMECGDQSQSIHVEGGTKSGLSTLIGWRRDWCLMICDGEWHQKADLLAKGRASSRISFPYGESSTFLATPVKKIVAVAFVQKPVCSKHALNGENRICRRCRWG
jgi:hypothetical protein